MVDYIEDRVDGLAASMCEVFAQGRTRPLAWRLRMLRAAKQMLADHCDAWVAAVVASTGKPATEAIWGDVCCVQAELNDMITNVSRWSQANDVCTPLALIPASSRIEKQPYGATLVIAPCNYPVLLALCPLFGAIAAGNTAVLKVSELCPEVSDLCASLLTAYLDPDAVRVVRGGVRVVSALLEQRWDNIIFTGSVRVGRMVAMAAARGGR